MQLKRAGDRKESVRLDTEQRGISRTGRTGALRLCDILVGVNSALRLDMQTRGRLLLAVVRRGGSLDTQLYSSKLITLRFVNSVQDICKAG